MTGIVRACCLALLLLWHGTSAAEDVPPDREALISYAESALIANLFDDDLDAHDLAITRAGDWLVYASGGRSDLGEALMHARRVGRDLGAALPDLRARLDAFPDEVPSFPPVLYWYENWSVSRKATLDRFALLQKGILREVAAIEAQEWELAASIRAERAQDDVAFNAYHAKQRDAAVEMLPDGHPERILATAFEPWDSYYQLFADREAMVDEAEAREITLEMVRVAKEASEAMQQTAEKLNGALAAHGRAMQPLMVIMTGDPASGAVVTKETLSSYRRSAALLTELAEAYRGYARLELEFWQNGFSQELLEKFEVLSPVFSNTEQKLFHEWTRRAQLMSDAADARKE